MPSSLFGFTALLLGTGVKSGISEARFDGMIDGSSRPRLTSRSRSGLCDRLSLLVGSGNLGAAY